MEASIEKYVVELRKANPDVLASQVSHDWLYFNAFSKSKL